MIPWLAAAVGAWSLDRLTKIVAERRVGLGSIRRWGPLRIRPTCHRRGGRGPSRLRWLLVGWLLAVASAGALVAAGRAFSGVAPQIGLGSALGGAAGNLQDLHARGAIFDFLDLGLGVFNLADVAIVAGLAVAVLAPLAASGGLS